jgi:hypothetical protein
MRVRPYQLDILCIMNNLRPGQRALIQAATGTGKTFCIANAMLETPILILCHRAEILSQLKKARPDADCITIQSAHKIKNIHAYKTIIIDESHHCASAQYVKFINQLSDSQILIGFTATPRRYDEKDLSFAFGDKVAYSYSFLKAVKQGFLCNIKAHRISTSVSFADIVNPEQYEIELEALSKLIKPDFCNSLIFVNLVEKSNLLASLYPKDFMQSLHGQLNKKYIESTLNKYRNQEIKNIVSCDLLTEGVDLPNTENIIIARNINSPVLYCQVIGRGSRLSQGAYSIADSKKKFFNLYELFNFNDLKSELFFDINYLLGYESDKKNSAKSDILDIDALEIIEKNNRYSPQDILLKVKEYDFFKYKLIKADWIKLHTGHLIIPINMDFYCITPPDAMGFSELYTYEHGLFDMKKRDNFKRLLDFCDEYFDKYPEFMWLKKRRKKWSDEPATPKQVDELKKFGLLDEKKCFTKLQAARILPFYWSGIASRLLYFVRIEKI